jgi:hypothetical protein
MDVFLRKLAGYVTAERQMEAHSSVTASESVARFVRYQKSHLAISLTQAGVIGPMKVVACSTTTADKTFMTAGGVATLYPEFTLYGKNVCTENTQQFHGRENRIGHQRVTHLLWKVICPFLEAHVVALVPRSGVHSQTMALMGFSTGTRAGMSSGSSRIVMSSGEYMKDALMRTANGTTTRKIGSFGPLRVWCLPMKLT